MSQFPSAKSAPSLIQTRLSRLVAFWRVLTRPASADFSGQESHARAWQEREESTPSHKDDARHFAESFRFMHF